MRLVKKFFIYCINIADIFLFLRLCVNFVYKTLSNELATSMLRSVAIFSLFSAHTVYIFLSRKCNAVSTNRCFLALICVLGRSACVSAKKRILFATIASKAFPSMLNSVISLYTVESI
jgi:hypothetical protein